MSLLRAVGRGPHKILTKAPWWSDTENHWWPVLDLSAALSLFMDDLDLMGLR